MKLAAGARLFLVLILVLAVAGCQVTPPEGAYFDVDHHPFGAIPSNAGFYVGAYVVAVPLQCAYLLGVFIPHEGGLAHPTEEKMKELSFGCGATTGVLLGAPFHLVALPFRLMALPFKSRAVDAGPATLDEPAPGGDPRYDDTPTAVPRDYPWPPKPSR